MAPRMSAGVRHGLLRHAMCEWFGIGEARADLLIALFDAGGSPRVGKDLCRAVDRHKPMSMEAFYESIRLLRATLDSEALDRSGDGYWLTEVGLAECRRCFEAMGARLATITPTAPKEPA